MSSLNKEQITEILTNMEYSSNDITRALKKYEKYYGKSYDIEMMKEIIVKLQNEDKPVDDNNDENNDDINDDSNNAGILGKNPRIKICAAIWCIVGVVICIWGGVRYSNDKNTDEDKFNAIMTIMLGVMFALIGCCHVYVARSDVCDNDNANCHC